MFGEISTSVELKMVNGSHEKISLIFFWQDDMVLLLI